MADIISLVKEDLNRSIMAWYLEKSSIEEQYITK